MPSIGTRLQPNRTHAGIGGPASHRYWTHRIRDRMEEDNALSIGVAAWCAGDRVGDPVSDLSLSTERESALDAVSRELNEGVVTIRRLF